MLPATSTTRNTGEISLAAADKTGHELATQIRRELGSELFEDLLAFEFELLIRRESALVKTLEFL